MKFLKITAAVFCYILGIYLLGRALVEPFIVDYHHPETYRQLWGGPTLVGVMAVHMLPGVLSTTLMVRRLRAWRRNRSGS